MATIVTNTQEKYYQTDRPKVPYFVLHVALKAHFADMLFGGDQTRIEYASNDYALRKRSDSQKEESHLNFPFLNYKRTQYGFDDTPWRYHRSLFNDGVYIDEIGTKIRANPSQVTFEGTFWTDNEQDLVEASRRINFDADGVTEFDYDVQIKNITTGDICALALHAQLNYTSRDFDPTYNEQDWLDINKIHTIGLDFNVSTWDINPADPEEPIDYSITETVIYNYKVKNFLGQITDEEVYQFLVSELDDDYYS